MKRYAVLFVPEFRLQATLRHSPELATQPVALLEGIKPVIAERNALAESGQVQRGMTPTQALSRCAELRLITPNSGHEISAQEILLQTAERLSPFLESTASGVITVELPSERTWSDSDFEEKIVTPLRSSRLDVQVGVAATPDLALLAAHCAEPVKIVSEAAPFLAPLPVGVLQPTTDLNLVFEMWGIHTIGQLIALPRTQTCDRLGADAVTLWERAMGGRPRPLQLVKPQESFIEQADLEYAVETLEPLLFLLRRFLEHLATRLEQVYLVAGKLRLRLRFENGATYERIFTIPQPTRDVNLLFRMLHTHLETFTAVAAIVALELVAKPVRPTTEQFGLLEKGLRDPHQFSETYARLQALLGNDRVGTPKLKPSHHPDAFDLRPYTSASPVVKTEEPLTGIPWLRFRPAIQARVILSESRCPAFLYSPRCTGPIHESKGPWRLEGNWWDPEHWAREEWDIATDEGMYRLIRVEDQWLLDGIYA